MTPVKDARLIFSDTPFSDPKSGKTEFNTSDFIYGRLELKDQTVWNAFEMKSLTTPNLFLRCWVMVYHSSKNSSPWQSWEYMLVKRGSEKNKWFNFDLLPDPSKATTVMGPLWDFDPAVAAGPLYQQIALREFNVSGEYTIKVKIFLEGYDAWGKETAISKWPSVEGEFKLVYNEKDIPLILKNYTLANEKITIKFKQYLKSIGRVTR